MSHETAHNWCTGADINTFEDWLNEGTADWSALLYALHVGDKKLFDFIINLRKEYADTSQPLKPADGSRPPFVHANSTLLLHKIYCKYGKSVTQNIVQMFVNLEEKTTEMLLEKIRKEIANDVAEDILKGLQWFT